jgi:hypothetical protein
VTLRAGARFTAGPPARRRLIRPASAGTPPPGSLPPASPPGPGGLQAAKKAAAAAAAAPPSPASGPDPGQNRFAWLSGPDPGQNRFAWLSGPAGRGRGRGRGAAPVAKAAAWAAGGPRAHAAGGGAWPGTWSCWEPHPTRRARPWRHTPPQTRPPPHRHWPPRSGGRRRRVLALPSPRRVGRGAGGAGAQKRCAPGPGPGRGRGAQQKVIGTLHIRYIAHVAQIGSPTRLEPKSSLLKSEGQTTWPKILYKDKQKLNI